MNKQQKDKFHKAIKDLSDILTELNQDTSDVYQLCYDQVTCKFDITRIGLKGKVDIIEKDDTYIPDLYVEE